MTRKNTAKMISKQEKRKIGCILTLSVHPSLALKQEHLLVAHSVTLHLQWVTISFHRLCETNIFLSNDYFSRKENWHFYCAVMHRKIFRKKIRTLLIYNYFVKHLLLLLKVGLDKKHTPRKCQ